MNVDAIQFWGQGQFKLTITAPFGPGSIRLANAGGGAGNGYWTAVTLTQGAFPNGWLFGVDVGLPELLGEVASGVPSRAPSMAPADRFSPSPSASRPDSRSTR